MPFQCPRCRRPIYNRRRKDCEFCAGPIPDALRFSPRQLRAIEHMKVREAAEHREWMGSHMTLDTSAAPMISLIGSTL